MSEPPKGQALSAGSYLVNQTVTEHAGPITPVIGGPREKSGGLFVRKEDPKKNTQARVAAVLLDTCRPGAICLLPLLSRQHVNGEVVID